MLSKNGKKTKFCKDRDNSIRILAEKNNDLSIINKINSLNNPIDNILNLDNLKYFSDDRILKFSNGYENNNYVILSIIYDKIKVFKYLFRERNLDIKFKNSNGWTILHFILYHKRIGNLSLHILKFNFCLYKE